MIYVLTFIIGVVLGSFYNVVASRTLSGESLAYPPSHCVNCNHRLSYLDLVPVLSWVALRGKCRHCREKISPVYPYIELLTGLSYVLIVFQFGFTLEALIQVVSITIMIIATATDLREMIVPDRFIVIGLVSVFILRLIQGDMVIHYLISSVVAFGVLFLIFVLSRGGMGGADVKLYALIGLSIGWMDSMGSLFYAAIIALIFYIVVTLIRRGKLDRKLEIPFVPFITLGVLCTYFLTLFTF